MVGVNSLDISLKIIFNNLMTTTTTNTPRTDAAAGHATGLINEGVLFCSRQLERELADARQWLDERYKALSEADDRAEKAEAEVERLREKLKQAIEIAHRYDEGWADASDLFDTFLDNLDKFNPDKK